jgi:hypothetical protein
VNTAYGQRPASAAEADVRNYRSWYGVTDIFLDQVTGSAPRLSYYRRLSGYVHGMSPGALVMLNPGAYPDRQYMAVGDILMVYENTYAKYAHVQVPRWAGNYPAARFAHTIYATPRSRLANAISLARRRHAGYVYVTGNQGLNPYNSLPGYWSSEDALVASGCGGG